MWNGHYYLIGNYDTHDNVSHYRLDRMTSVEILELADLRNRLFGIIGKMYEKYKEGE